jgi:hypothetical protein
VPTVSSDSSAPLLRFNSGMRGIGFLVLAVLSSTSITAAETTYRFSPGPARTYLAETRQEVAWDAAGDRLTYSSTLALSQIWKCVGSEGAHARVEVTTVRVLASHRGPGAEHTFDSAIPESASDPLLGHCKALEGVTLTLVIEQATGATRVSGGERIAAAIAKRTPNLVDPAAPSPLAIQASELYSDANLSRIWSQTLALPAAPSELPLGAPLSGTLLRTWKELTYQLSGTPSGSIILAQDPTPVTATASAVTGTGSVALHADGWPQTCAGSMSYGLNFEALTMPVLQQHQVRWQLTRAK